MITLKKNFEFKKVLSRGKCFNENLISIYIFPNKLNIVRMGFAIGKKAGNAVDRNRIKRLVRENVRLKIDRFQTNNDFIFVWKNKKTAENVSFFEIEKEVEKFLRVFSEKK